MFQLQWLTSDIYLNFLESLGDAVVVANRTGQILFWNRDAATLLSGQPEMLLHCKQDGAYQILNSQGQPLSPEELPFQQVFAGKQLHDCELAILDTHTDATVWLSINGGLLEQKNLEQKKLEQAPVNQTIADTAILTIRDISLRKQREVHTLDQACRDSLTGLANRERFMQQLAWALSQSKALCEGQMTVLYLDLDRIKAVNSHLGHTVGNHLIVEVVQRLQQHLRADDFLARLGGDEFAILLAPGASATNAIDVAESLRTAISSPFHLQQHDVYIDVSIGIALGSKDHLHPEDWLRDAKLAMEHVKTMPDLHWYVFDRSSQAQEEQRLQIESDLRRAIAEQQLRLHYQPIVTISNQEIVGFEALVRWQHPERGLLLPGEFVCIAETSDLIIPLGWWVLEEACRQMQAWTQQYPHTKDLSVSVNMSSRQFAQKSLVKGIQKILDKTGFPPTRLHIELTEGVLIDHSASIIATLKDIQSMGIRLSIDDFGTGYSSLSYLHQFPFDTLKIDRCFIENADQDFEKLEILQSVVRLAWNLGLNVVAEGIETQRHYAQLKALRCESGQGYLFSKPLEPDIAEGLLRTLSISHELNHPA
jgi:diguanylate cyclase (GGDEF)-like protein